MLARLCTESEIVRFCALCGQLHCILDLPCSDRLPEAGRDVALLARALL